VKNIQIQNDKTFITSYDSFIELKNLTLTDSGLLSTMFEIISSTFSMEQISVNNCSQEYKNAFILSIEDSNGLVQMEISNSRCYFAFIDASKIDFEYLNV